MGLQQLVDLLGQSINKRLEIRQSVLDYYLIPYNGKPVQFAFVRPFAEIVADAEATVFYHNYRR